MKNKVLLRMKIETIIKNRVALYFSYLFFAETIIHFNRKLNKYELNNRNFKNINILSKVN